LPEERLGARLLDRTTQGLGLTQVGQQVALLGGDRENVADTLATIISLTAILLGSGRFPPR
jgi:DNA-binding transcriptional LysR family regulator